MNNQQELKQQVALAALEYFNDYDMVVGIGTGSTVNCLIDILPKVKNRIGACVSSSTATTKRLKAQGFEVMELNQSGPLSLYIDGADECDSHNRLIKGGGGALTREKIIAAASDKFICIVDATKIVNILGKFPLPVEVIPMAQSHVGRALAIMGGQPILREGFKTDNGNIIIDVHNLKILDPLGLESKINNIAGVVCHGIFAQQKAFATLIANQSGVTVQK
ncbi:Ribose 5-phosphate isomerase A [hydrothermal vent metagenome]|uniref:ribose-5-phosphate isomerase n=1 Tax=hydrothermal vent metagenome TaxID=652676 RepID=A0A3B0VP37_9ZZZZ